MYSLQIHEQENRTHYISRGIKMYSLQNVVVIVPP